MEDIGFDVGTVGNHEFDEGTNELKRIINGGDHPDGKGTSGYDGQNFPLVCANCKLKSGSPFCRRMKLNTFPEFRSHLSGL